MKKIYLLALAVLVVSATSLTAFAEADTSPNVPSSSKPATSVTPATGATKFVQPQYALKPGSQDKIARVKQMYPKAHFSYPGDNKDKTRGQVRQPVFFAKRERAPFEFSERDLDDLLSKDHVFQADGKLYLVFGSGILAPFDSRMDSYDTYTYDWFVKNATTYFHLDPAGHYVNVIHPPKSSHTSLAELWNIDGRLSYEEMLKVKNGTSVFAISAVVKSYNVDSHDIDDPSANNMASTTVCHVCGIKREKPLRWA